MQRLLERGDALVAIDDLIGSAGRGDGLVVLVEAAAGVGKTALLAAAREMACGRALNVAHARGAELERAFSFGIVRQLLEPLVAKATWAEREELFSGAARLAAPLVRPQERETVAGPASTGSSGLAAGPVMHGLYWLLVGLVEQRPLLLCVDDVHWADAASLRWLEYIARRLEGLAVAVLLAGRPGEPGVDPEPLAAISAEPVTTSLPLAPLSRRGSAQLVRRVLEVQADDEFCSACHLVSGGNPFLLRELAHSLARDGVEPTAGSAHLVRELVPDAVTRSLVLRLARLPESACVLARAVAVLDSGATLHQAAALAELHSGEAASVAGALAAVAILRRELPLDFVHPLVRAAVYGDLPAAERAVWHAAAARVLDAEGARSERVAAQLLRSEPASDPWVVARLRAAAADAVARADPRTAVGFLRRAFVEPASGRERVEVLQELSQAGLAALDLTATDDLGVDLLAEIAADEDALKSSALQLVMYLWIAGRTRAALELLQRALIAASTTGDNDLALRLEVQWITLTQHLPRDAVGRLEPYDRRVGPETLAGRLVDASLAYYGSITGRDCSETAERLRRAFADGRLVTELEADYLVLAGHVYALLWTDELELAEQVIERILKRGRLHGSATAVAAGSYHSAYLAFARGDLVRAHGDIESAVAAFREAGAMTPRPMTALLVDTLVERGHLDAAANELAVAGLAEDIPDHWWYGPVLWSRGYLRLAQGKTDLAIDDLLEFQRRYERDGLVATVVRPWASHAASFLARHGEPDLARRLAERELDEARAWGTRRAIGQALRGLGLVLGGQDGIELLRSSVATLETSPARLEQARSLIELGAALRRANRRSESREPLRLGLQLAHRCGAVLLAGRADKELRATGARPRKVVVTGLDALTASERRIAEMAAGGLTNREIAQALFVTIKTVETHMGHAFQKLDVHARADLAQKLAPSGNFR